MLLVIPPTANVLIPIRPQKRALSVLLPILKVSVVLPPITPRLCSSALHVAHPELTLVELFHVCKEVLPVALELSIHEVSLVVATVFPVKPTLAVLPTLEEIPTVGVLPIVPTLLALAVLQVVLPFTHVPSSVSVYESSLAVGLVIFPLALVDVSVGMGHPTVAIALAYSPSSFVLRAVRP